MERHAILPFSLQQAFC